MSPSLEDKLCNRTGAIGPFCEQGDDVSFEQGPAVCAVGHEVAALHQPINMRAKRVSEVSNLSYLCICHSLNNLSQMNFVFQHLCFVWVFFFFCHHCI